MPPITLIIIMKLPPLKYPWFLDSHPRVIRFREICTMCITNWKFDHSLYTTVMSTLCWTHVFTCLSDAVSRHQLPSIWELPLLTLNKVRICWFRFQINLNEASFVKWKKPNLKGIHVIEIYIFLLLLSIPLCYACVIIHVKLCQEHVKTANETF